MQQLQAYRASTIAAVTAAAMLVFTGLASAQAQSAERVVNGDTEVQVTSAPIRTDQRYRAAQWLLDMLPDKAPNTGDDEFIYGDDMVFLSIFWTSYIPIVMVILWLIGDWLMRRFRKLRHVFSFLIPTTPFELKLEPQAGTGEHHSLLICCVSIRTVSTMKTQLWFDTREKGARL